MKVRYDYYEKLRQAVLSSIEEHQPVTLVQLTQHLASTHSFQMIKNELKRLTADDLVYRQRASKYEDPKLAGGTGFYCSIPKPKEEVQS
jgi:predicted ArsR family transcriptional regulator